MLSVYSVSSYAFEIKVIFYKEQGKLYYSTFQKEGCRDPSRTGVRGESSYAVQCIEADVGYCASSGRGEGAALEDGA
jgi:hypothetical protein